MDIVVATAENGGLQFIYDQAKREGWEPGPMDPVTFSSVDPSGFFVAVVDENMVGCLSAVRFDDRYGFIGYYIVIPEARGRGYGLRLFQHGMLRLRGCNIGLDAALEQEANYMKSNFRSYHTNFRFRGVVDQQRPICEGSSVAPLSDVDIDDLRCYDRIHFPATRDKWIQHWRNNSIPGCIGLASVQDGEVVGYGIARPSVSGYKIGPLFADSPRVASDLLCALQTHMTAGTAVYMDIPEVNAEAVRHATEVWSMEPMFESRRMYTLEEPPGILWSQVYGLSSLELG